MSKPRMTLSRWLLAVLITGLLLWPFAARRSYRRLAAAHGRAHARAWQRLSESPEQRESEYLREMWFARESRPVTEPPYKFRIEYSKGLQAEIRREYMPEIEYRGRMIKRYRYAADHPWVIVSSEPTTSAGRQ